MFQACNCNHSVLISSLGMEFGYRNCVVVVGCPNSRKRLNKLAKQTCTVHECLNGTHNCDCKPPFHVFPFPTEKTDSEGRRRCTENIKREISKGKNFELQRIIRECAAYILKTANLRFGMQLQLQSCGRKAKEPIRSVQIISEMKPRKTAKTFRRY